MCPEELIIFFPFGPKSEEGAINAVCLLLQNQTFHWVGNLTGGEREAQKSPKPVHLALKPKPCPPNSSN